MPNFTRKKYKEQNCSDPPVYWISYMAKSPNKTEIIMGAIIFASKNVGNLFIYSFFQRY